MFSRFFIERPIFASVISIIIVLAGLASLGALPVAQYPSIIPPDVAVSTTYPGASAEVVAGTVAAPLEQQINGAPGMIYLRSTSSNSGQMRLTATFEIGTDPDQAAIEVNNRVQAALARMPEEVRRQGVTVNKRGTSILLVITMFSPDDRYDPIFISNYALINVMDELKRTPGVGEATLFGAKDYSMRVWLKPDRLAQYNLTPADVAAAIREQNSQFAAGAFGQEPMTDPPAFTYAVTTQGQMADPREFENIIIRSDASGASLKLKDVARIELGAQDYNFVATTDGKNAVAIGVYLQPGSNALSTAKAVADRMAEIRQRFPQGIDYSIPFDTTKFVEVSINEVIHTFVVALVLVIGVVFLFLQNLRATLIPLLAVPVSLIGTLAGMLLLGFSINLLTLFGMVLAIGIVVDDAIVVLENFERNLSAGGLTPREAAIKAMSEVTGPIVAIVLVLCAVFIPVGFMGGMTGEMYRQFAITIAISVVISGIVALTLTPALCALLIRPSHGEPAAPFRAFNAWFARLTERYMRGVRFLLDRMRLGLLLFAGFTALAVFLVTLIPASLVPEEDQGYIFVVPMLPPGASLARTQAVAKEMTKRLLSQPEIAHATVFAGLDLLSFSQRSNAGAAFVNLAPWAERTERGSDAKSMTWRIMGMMGDIKEAMVFAFNPPPITGISLTGGFEGYLQNRGGGDIRSLAATTGRLIEEASKRPELAGMQTTFSVGVPQYHAELDRVKARALGVPIDSVFAAMQSTFGSYYVNDFTLYGRTFRVSMQSEAEFRETPDDLRYVFVRSTTGHMIPLDTLVSVKRITGPDIVERYNVFPASKIMGGPAPGYSSGQALAAMEEVAAKVLPDDYTLAWTGAAYQEKAAGSSGVYAFIFGIVMVFLILAAQYERWSLPFVVLTAVPFAVFGAALAVWLRGLGNDVYFQVGLLTLIGLGAKNAILIVEFASLRHEQGLSRIDAAIEAAQLRFRPIVMTSLAFILGCVPLAISSGAGAASRHSIGTGVIGGMLAATAIATLFVPMFYRLVARIAERGHEQPVKERIHE